MMDSLAIRKGVSIAFRLLGWLEDWTWEFDPKNIPGGLDRLSALGLVGSRRQR